MKRKLVKQGQRALTITLPSSWVEKNNLNQGDDIDLLEVDDALTISTEKIQAVKEIKVDIKGLSPRLADRFITRAYQKGYDKITINYDNPELMLAIKNKVPELMGFEILNISKHEMEVQTISSQLDLDFDIILRRAFLILMDMTKICNDSWKSNDNVSLENIYHQDFDVNRFLYFCLRYLNKSKKVMTFGRSILYYLIESLEDLGDELKELGKNLAKTKPDKDVLQILSRMNEMFRLSYEFFYTPDKNKANSAFQINKEISLIIDKQIENNDSKFIKILISIEFSRRIIYHIVTMRLDTLKELSEDK